MTEHEKAILKALIDFDGKATNKQIYEHAMMYATYGGNTPKNTIRRDLQQCPFTRPVEGTTGIWEIVPLDKISEEKDAANSKLSSELERERMKNKRLEDELQNAKCFARLAVLYMKANMNKSQSKREEIKRILLDMACQLKLIIPSDIQQLINAFDDINPPTEQIIKICEDAINRQTEAIDRQTAALTALSSKPIHYHAAGSMNVENVEHVEHLHNKEYV